MAGSDAPVDSQDPRPFENMAAGIVRAAGSDDAFRASQRISLAEMLAAYTINGARAVRQGRSPAPSRRANPPTSSCSTGICSLVEAGTPEQIADTRVEQTVFQGNTIYPAPEPNR